MMTEASTVSSSVGSHPESKPGQPDDRWMATDYRLSARLLRVLRGWTAFAPTSATLGDVDEDDVEWHLPYAFRRLLSRGEPGD